MYDRVIEFLTNAMDSATAGQIYFNIGQEEGYDRAQTIDFLESLVAQGVLCYSTNRLYGVGYGLNRPNELEVG